MKNLLQFMRKRKILSSLMLSLVLMMAFAVSAFAATMPTGLTATAGDGQVTLSWTATADGQYNVYQSTDNVAYTKITSSTVTTTTYTVNGLTNGTTYYFKITSFDGSAESTQTASVSATPAAAGSGGSGPVTFSGATLPFTVPDMISTATNFLGMYAQWILLALGVIFSPVLYGLAMRLVSAVKARSGH